MGVWTKIMWLWQDLVPTIMILRDNFYCILGYDTVWYGTSSPTFLRNLLCTHSLALHSPSTVLPKRLQSTRMHGATPLNRVLFIGHKMSGQF